MIRNLTALDEIDFLPEPYRQRGVQRRAYVWRGMLLLACIAALAALTIVQRGRQAVLEFRLQEMAPQYRAAEQQQARLADVQKQLKRERGAAGLLTYLRHPWPRTQVMATILEPLPESVTLTDWQVVSELPRGAPTVSASSETKGPPPDQSARHDRDLTRLLAEYGNRQQVVILTGHATEAEALHDYLARLEAAPLIAKVELRSIEDLAADKKQSRTHSGFRFTARATLRPGHGQSATVPAPPAAGGANPPLAQRGGPS